VRTRGLAINKDGPPPTVSSEWATILISIPARAWVQGRASLFRGAAAIQAPRARFGVLRRQIEGISARVLTERLRLLEQRGFVYRDYKPTIPPAVTYGITKRMKDISRVLNELERL
jgi:hypothetical protein